MVNSKGISIIVPIFNTAPYLDQCIDSVLNQTYNNWELILINDGSTDNSAKICEKFCQIDSRISLISYATSKGPSYARNCGINVSTGKYLFFLDSDDAIHPALLEEMWDLAEKEMVGIVISNYENTEQSTIPQKWNDNNSSTNWILLSAKDTLEWWLNATFTATLGIGGKLFLKNSVGALRFNEQIYCGEDLLFIYQVLQKSNITLAYTNEKRYWRVVRRESISHKSTIDTIYDELRVWHEIIETEMSFDREKNVMVSKEHLVSILCNLYSDPINATLHNKTLIKKIISKEYARGMFNHIRFKSRLKYILCMLTPTLYRWLRKCKKKIYED